MVQGFEDGTDRVVFVGFDEEDIAVVRSGNDVVVEVQDGAALHSVRLTHFGGIFDHGDYTVM